jgi:hypothetical protein
LQPKVAFAKRVRDGNGLQLQPKVVFAKGVGSGEDS